MNSRKIKSTILASSLAIPAAVSTSQQNIASANFGNFFKSVKNVAFIGLKILAIPILGSVNGAIAARQQNKNIRTYKYKEEMLRGAVDSKYFSKINDDVQYYVSRAFIYGFTFGLCGQVKDFGSGYLKQQKSAKIDEKDRIEPPFKHLGFIPVNEDDLAEKEESEVDRGNQHKNEGKYGYVDLEALEAEELSKAKSKTTQKSFRDEQ